MTVDEFLATLGDDSPPTEIPAAAQALWYAENGDWERAHRVAQDISTTDGSWVHACLHREEGDLGNAGYWYRRSGKPPATGDLREERLAILLALLQG